LIAVVADGPSNNVLQEGQEMRDMKIEEYIDKLNFEEVWPRIESGRDEETINLLQDGKHRFKDILASIPSSSKPIKLLDIGTTPFTFFIKDIYPHYEVSTIDLTNLAEDSCKARGIIFKVHDMAEQPVPFETDYFDIVIFTEVLEHLFTPPSEVLMEINRIIKPGGTLIFSVPNMAALIKRIRLLFGMSPLPHPDEQMKKGWIHGYGHPREYTMKECTAILESCSFRIQKRKFLHPDLKASKRQTNRGMVAFFINDAATSPGLPCYPILQGNNLYRMP
jgi:SAM-dependent methyltransferase